MKEIILLNLYICILYYKINHINKYCIIYVKRYLTKLDIKYIFIYILKLKYSKLKINNIIDKKNFLKKYYILF